MMFQHKDGELRIYEHGNWLNLYPLSSGVTQYMEILFADANLTGPLGRSLPAERLVMDRSTLDSNAHYVEEGDASRMEPLSLTFSCKTADTLSYQLLMQMMSGTSLLSDSGSATTYQMNTRTGKGIDMYGFSVTPPSFRDDLNNKVTYMVEVMWSGTSNLGMRWDEVLFHPNEQTVTEAEDSVTLNLNGMIYGGVTQITFFTGNDANNDAVAGSGVSALPWK
jgi:hypothetical protein